MPEVSVSSTMASLEFPFLGLNVHFDIFACRNGPSVIVRLIFEFDPSPISLGGVQTNAIQMEFLVHPVNTGFVPIHYNIL